MIYEIEGKLIDPESGQELPIRAKFSVKDFASQMARFEILEIIAMLETRCNIYESNKLYDKMEVVERILCEIKERFNNRIKDDSIDKHNTDSGDLRKTSEDAQS